MMLRVTVLREFDDEDLCTTVPVFGCRVFCGTWNVNGREPSAELHEWLSAQDEDKPPDIYAIGLAFHNLCCFYFSSERCH